MKTQCYVLIFCTVLLGFTFVVVLCLSPLHWAQFVMVKEETFLARLWTIWGNDLHLSHIQKASYYLQFSRAFFLISSLTVFITLIWLSICLTKGPGHKLYIGRGISIAGGFSGLCLLLCLVLFFMQVQLYSTNILKPQFLLVYHLNWCGSIFFMTVGFLSGFRHMNSWVSPSHQNLLIIPMTRTRLNNIDSVEVGINETNTGYSDGFPCWKSNPT